jgi:hypothetical protein
MERILHNVPLVRRELDTCLFAVTASILRYRRWDDVMSLGALWSFNYPLCGIARTEYYLPVRSGSLMETMLVGQGVRSTWRTTDEASQGWFDLAATISSGQPAAIAVDNYHLPFRPAYRDVHSNHLILVYGIDDERDLVYVLDATPPAFKGPIPAPHLRQARASGNPEDGDRDFFFSRSTIAHGQLDVIFPAQPWVPTQEAIRAAIQKNVSDLLDGSQDKVWLSGVSGILRLADLVERTAGEHCEDIFIASGVVLASRGRHAVFLKRSAVLLHESDLSRVARALEAIAHQWAAVRILASREARERSATVGRRLAGRLRQIAKAETAAARELATIMG